jgi:hypothetical protein
MILIKKIGDDKFYQYPKGMKIPKGFRLVEPNEMVRIGKVLTKVYNKDGTLNNKLLSLPHFK